MSDRIEEQLGQLRERGPRRTPEADLERLIGDAIAPVSPIAAATERMLLPLIVGLAMAALLVAKAELRTEQFVVLWGLPLVKLCLGSWLMWLCLRFAEPGQAPSRPTTAVALIVAMAGLVVVALVLDGLGSAMTPRHAASRCGAALIGVATLPLIGIFWLLARGAVFDSLVAGFLGGLSAGMFGDAALHLTCPVTGLSHNLVWHSGALVLFSVLAAIIAVGLARRWRRVG